MQFKSFITCLLLGGFIMLGVSSCNKESKDEAAQRAKEESIITQYVSEQKITTKRTEKGIYYYKTLENPTGAAVEKGDTIYVHYTGSLLKGNIFDSSLGRSPFKVIVGAGDVIEGWEDAVLTLREAEKGTYIMPSHLCYGDRGAGSAIPPYSILVFDMNVLSVKKKRK